MKELFENNLGTNAKRGMVIGTIGLGLIALATTGGIFPMMIFSVIGLIAGAMAGSFADPKPQKPTRGPEQPRPKLDVDRGNGRELRHEQHVEHELYHHDRYYRLNEPHHHRERIERERKHGHDRDEGHYR